MFRSMHLDRRELVLSKTQTVILLIFFPISIELVALIRDTTIQLGLPSIIAQTIQIVVSLVLLLIITYVLRETLKKNWNNFIRNRSSLIKNTLWILFLYVLMMITMALYNYITNPLLPSGSEPGNQDNIRQLVKVYPVAIFVAVVIYAPIVEEYFFRGIFYANIRSGRFYLLAILASSVIFALPHVLPSLLAKAQFSELVFLGQYIIMGFYFTLAYEKTHSIYGSVGLHFVNNLLSFIVLYISL